MNLKLKHGILLLVSLSLVITSLYVWMPANNSAQMKELSFGYPFSFVSQDFSDFDKSFSFFPRYERIDLFKRPVERFDIFNFVLSLSVVFVILEAVIFFLEWAKYKIREQWMAHQRSLHQTSL